MISNNLQYKENFKELRLIGSGTYGKLIRSGLFNNS